MFDTIKKITLLSLASAMVAPSAGADDIGSTTLVRQMADAAQTLLASLAPEQRKKAIFPFDDTERFDWHYVPRGRSGLPLKALNEEQRRLAHRFLETGLSDEGYWKATSIMELERVLREIETWNWLGRDPENYYFSFFGEPSEAGTWGWRVEGHHLSLNVTVVAGRLLADAPRFLGANPAEVRSGALAGTRVLRKEEDLARALVRSLDDGQRRKAVFRDGAFRDIVTGSSRAVEPLKPDGIRAFDLTKTQKERLMALIYVYAAAMPADIARQRMERVQKTGDGDLYFGWAGSLAPGEPHYYRIQGLDFLIEYDNVQNEANHIHTVWRDFDGDFGRDLLRDHYREAHASD
jgi:hypothetical protein